MSWQVIKELKEQRALKNAAATELRSKAHKENRDLSADEAKQHDALFAEVESINTRINREEKAGALDEAINANQTRSLIGRENRDANDIIHKDMGRYSFLRAIRKTLKGEALDGVEAEVNKEMEKRMGGPAKGSFYLPHQYRVKRALNTSTGSGAVMTTTEDELIDVLRPKLITSKLGVTVMGDLHGQIKIPQKTAAGSYYWLGDGGAATGSTPTLSQVLFTPHTIGGYTDITRQFAEQTSVDAEKLVIDDLTADLGVGIDTSFFQGTGSSNQPTGILNASGVTTVSNGTNGGAPDYALINSLVTQVENANSNIDNARFAMTPNAKGYLKTLPRSTAAVAAGFVWDDDNEVSNYPAIASNVLPNNLTKGSGTNLSAIVFGNFNDAVIGMWGALDILVDPYTGSNAGTVRVVALQDLDIEFRHTASFSQMVDVNTTVS